MAVLGFEGDNAREKVIVLLTMCFALAMVMLDNTVVNVALPAISEKLGAGVSGLQWIVDGYVLALASLLLTGGIMGDRYGRKKMFLTGLTIFTLASFGCGVSGSTGMLVVFRAIQGIGAALLLPGTLSIITVTFPPQERAKAIGLWAGMSGLALALGPTIGGLMVEHLGWQSIFFLNVPIGIVAFFVATRTVKESVSEEERQLDIPGLILGTGALFSLTYALIEANQKGWSDPLIVSTLVGGAILIVALLYWELHAPHPMMPLKFFRIPAFSAGNTVAFSVSLGMFATFFFLSLYMQLIRGYTPFQAGIRFLPMTLMIVVTAPLAGKYAQQHGSRAPMTYGLLLAGGGLIFLGTQLQVDTSFWVAGAGLHDHGPRDGLGDGADDGGRDELGRSPARRLGLGHVEHEPRGGRCLRDRAPGHHPHDQAQGVPRPDARRAGLDEHAAARDRHRRRSRNPRPLPPHATRPLGRPEGRGHRGVRQRVHGRLPFGAPRRWTRPGGRRPGRVPVHPRPAHRARAGAGRTRSGGRRGVGADRA